MRRHSGGRAKVIEALLRVSRKAFISFPNFAHWRTRSALSRNAAEMSAVQPTSDSNSMSFADRKEEISSGIVEV